MNGFTLVEVLVALLLLSVGLVALCGAAAQAARVAGEAARLTQTAGLVVERLELLRSGSCTPGAARYQAIEVRWTATRVTVEWPVGGGPVFRSAAFVARCGA